MSDDHAYAIDVTPEGRRQLHKSPDKVYSAALAFVFESLAVNPRRVGKPLLAEMAGLWSARRAEYRVIYEIEGDNRVVLIHRAAHRRSVSDLRKSVNQTSFDLRFRLAQGSEKIY